MKNNEDLISIIVPVYNVEKYLDKCIESIINQTYTNLEIILVNDGSTDDCIKICELYAKKDSRIRIINKKHSGVSETRNIGIKNAKGNYVCFPDSDDYIDKNMIEELHNAIINKNVDIARCKLVFIEKNGNTRIEKLYDLADKKIEGNDIKNIFSYFVLGEKIIGSYNCLLMIKKEKIVYYNEELFFMEDTEFFLRLLLNVDSIYFLDKELYYYRYNETSASKNIDRVINNIYGMIDSNNCIKENLISNKIMTDELIKDMNNHVFYIMFLKLKILINRNLFEIRHSISKVFSNNKVKEFIKSLNFKNLTKREKIEYILIKLKLYFLLGFFMKMIYRWE